MVRFLGSVCAHTLRPRSTILLPIFLSVILYDPIRILIEAKYIEIMIGSLVGFYCVSLFFFFYFFYGACYYV